jgi:hypothetical protein
MNSGWRIVPRPQNTGRRGLIMTGLVAALMTLSSQPASAGPTPSDLVSSLQGLETLAMAAARVNATDPPSTYTEMRTIARQLLARIKAGPSSCRTSLGASVRLRSELSNKAKLKADVLLVQGGLTNCTFVIVNTPPQTTTTTDSSGEPQAIIEGLTYRLQLEGQGREGNVNNWPVNGNATQEATLDRGQQPSTTWPGECTGKTPKTCIVFVTMTVKRTQMGRLHKTNPEPGGASCDDSLEGYYEAPTKVTALVLVLKYSVADQLYSATAEEGPNFGNRNTLGEAGSIGIQGNTGCTRIWGDNPPARVTRPVDVEKLGQGDTIDLDFSASSSVAANNGNATIDYQWDQTVSFKLLPIKSK